MTEQGQDDENSELVLRPAAAVEKSLRQHEQVMLAVLKERGLPDQGVLVDIEERRRLFANLDDAMSRLEFAERGRALYLSKFVMAVSAGLFDAALNYLWDETIRELRRRVVNYDLAYFFDLAVTAPDRRKRLQGADDLPAVDDSELIRATKSMGLISDLGFQQLDLVRFMRNFASAAHPNQNELTGLQLVSFLETCVREVITLPETTVVAEVRRLLANIKSSGMDATQATQTASAFVNLDATQADNLGQGLFGIYVDQNSSVTTRDNVRRLMPYLWSMLSENVKGGFGVRYARFIANHDQQQAQWAREVLDLVGATSYLPEGVRAGEIDEAVDALFAAHGAMNNFYTEPGLARRLQELVGAEPVPHAVRSKYVMALVYVFLGRGSGVAWNADPIYRALISSLTPAEARVALTAFMSVEVSSKLQMATPSTQLAEMLTLLEPKFADRPARELVKRLQTFTGPRELMRLDSEIKRLTAAVMATTE